MRGERFSAEKQGRFNAHKFSAGGFAGRLSTNLSKTSLSQTENQPQDF
jgi:hypothetical protein